jgi:beta-lactamase regulating signal transducer with metallopeptidase domain
VDLPLRLLLTNAAAAALLAALAGAASLTVRRASVVHALWLLALVKLVTPPIAPLPLLPSWSRLALPSGPAPIVVSMPTPGISPTVEHRAALGEGSAVARALPPARVLVPATPSLGARRADLAPPALAGRGAPAGWDWRIAAGSLLGLGALAIVSLAALRFVRFGRLLADARPAPPAVAHRTSALATRMGLRRAPRVRLVTAGIPPMLWPARGGPLLLLPDRLVSELHQDELDALLAHEVAHVRRRDHWVRLVEIAATALFWWYPLTWWARRALRRAEERCCDEWVLRLLPRSAEAYANGLLKSLAFVADRPLPGVASGAGPVEDLEARLKEILMTRPAPPLAAPLRLALAAAAVLGLAVFPTHAQSSATKDEPAAVDSKAPTPAAEAVPAAQATPVTAPAPPPASPRSRSRAAAAPAPTPRPRATRPPLPAVAPVAVAAPTPLPAPALAPLAPRAALAPLAVLAGDEAPDSPERKAFEEQRRALDEQRQKLHQQQLELTRKQVELEARAEEAELEAQAARLRASGDAEAAARVEATAKLNGKRVSLQQRQLDLEMDRARLEAEMEEAAREGAEGATGELETKQKALQSKMQQAEDEIRALEMEERVEAIRGSADDLARSLAEQIESLKRDLPEPAAQRADVEREIQRLQAALDALRSTGTAKARSVQGLRAQP